MAAFFAITLFTAMVVLNPDERLRSAVICAETPRLALLIRPPSSAAVGEMVVIQAGTKTSR